MGPMKQSIQTTLLWDASIEAYRLRVPFSKELISFLKSTVPWSKRDWNPVTKQWSFHRDYFSVMEFLVTRLWPEIKIITEEEEVKAQQKHTEHISTGAIQMQLADAKAQFVRICQLDCFPEDVFFARRAYKETMKRLHPDMGGDAVEAASLNVMWGIVKRSLGD